MKQYLHGFLTFNGSWAWLEVDFGYFSLFFNTRTHGLFWFAKWVR